MQRMLGICLTLTLIWFAIVPTLADGPTTIEIADIGVSATIVPVYIQAMPDGSVTWDVSGLYMNAGLLTGLGTFGAAGNTVVGAHSETADGSPDLFYHLDAVQVGSHITINTNGQVLTYEVQNVYRVQATDLSPVYPTQDERLTLITCDISSYSSDSGTYSQRIVVVAVRIP